MIKLLRNAILVVGLTVSLAANAQPITHQGGLFSLATTWLDTDSISVTYTADFTSWTGNTDYVFAVDWKLDGYTIDTVDNFSTTAAGGWISSFGPTSAGGCGNDSNKTFACSEDDFFDELTAQATAGIVTWTWDVTFTTNITEDYLIGAAGHIGGFFYDCDHPKGCKAKEGLSAAIPIPEPTVIALMGVGLIGLGFATRRKTKV